MAIFNLLASDIKNLELKLEGKLPVDREELLFLVNSHGRNSNFYTENKTGNDIKINACHENEKYELSKLDVSEITNFDDIFKYSYFNGDINSWDVSNATSMKAMFNKNKNFNSPLDNWNTSNVTNMNSMFSYAKEFNQPLDKWDTSKVTSMHSMFYYTIKFNQPLDKWNTLNVTSMESIFAFAEKFNQNINSWDISKVNNMDFMFEEANIFNQPVLWDLSKVESCDFILDETKNFENKFNNGKKLPYKTKKIKRWIKDNQNKMIAIEIKENKANVLDKFLSNLNVIDSANLNGLHNVENNNKIGLEHE